METLDQPTNTDQRTASDGNRIIAYIIDAVVAGAVSFVPFVGWIAAIAYFLTRDGLPFLNGQSIGKKAMNIRAVSSDGQDLTNNWGPVIIRNIVLMIPLFPLIELIVMLTNPQKLRLGDQWAKTKVIAVA
ncbi:MAG: RDD family protein [Saprospiraceae bacterium]|nr:RDD family protein [Saprospiraceae bacterium]